MPAQPVRRKLTYRLYPTTAQAAALDRLHEAHRHLYNAALEERISAWRHGRHSIGYADQCGSLTAIRRDDPEGWGWINCSAQQITLNRLRKAFDAFFRRCKSGQAPGFPRFKSANRFAGFGYKGHGDGWRFTPGADGRHGHLRLQEVGTIRARGVPRTPPERIKSCELLRREGRWHLSLAVECRPRRQGGTEALAADWGVATLLTLAHGDGRIEEIPNPRFEREGEAQQATLQQALARKRRGSSRWHQARRRLARFKGAQARRRLDHAHKVAADIAGQCGAFAMEKLTVRNLAASAAGTVEAPGTNVQQKAGLNRAMLDTAPARLRMLIRYKVEETGGLDLDAPTRELKPSQRCPCCWAIRKKKLSERVHRCDACGHVEGRDSASARVVLHWLEGLLAGKTGREPAVTAPPAPQGNPAHSSDWAG